MRVSDVSSLISAQEARLTQVVQQVIHQSSILQQLQNDIQRQANLLSAHQHQTSAQLQVQNALIGRVDDLAVSLQDVHLNDSNRTRRPRSRDPTRPLCGMPTKSGLPCRNYADTCPVRDRHILGPLGSSTGVAGDTEEEEM